MKVINSKQDHLKYLKIFRKLRETNANIVVWQLFPENGRRVVADSVLKSFSEGRKILSFSSVKEFLDPSLPLYFYIDEGQFIFKSSLKDSTEEELLANFPTEIKLLDENEVEVVRTNIGREISTYWKTKRLRLEDLEDDDLTIITKGQRTQRDQDYLRDEFDLMLSIDKEDELFASARESKRVRPKEDKKVFIKRLDEEASFFVLFDLSQGGMAFLTNTPAFFPHGLKITILGFGDFTLDDPLIGIIVGQRPVDEFELDFKVGVKFEA